MGQRVNRVQKRAVLALLSGAVGCVAAPPSATTDAAPRAIEPELVAVGREFAFDLVVDETEIYWITNGQISGPSTLSRTYRDVNGVQEIVAAWTLSFRRR